ncbi:MAG TPA: amidase, partial [Pseudomonadales bacterium]|nr:amidase [Pseudomonadales bacterium]
MSDWKKAFRSFYYETADDPDDPELKPSETALLVIDIQNTYLEVPDNPTETARWAPFLERMNGQVIPGTATLIDKSRKAG